MTPLAQRHHQHKEKRTPMATLKVPNVVPSPQEDAEQLRKAFEGLVLKSICSI